MSSGTVHLKISDGVATIVFDHPEARNAMTWPMYDQFEHIITTLRRNRAIRLAVLRGAGEKAFIAGTDIEQFMNFQSSADGVAYEAAIDAHIGALESLPFPTLAVIRGYAVGGGLAIATACDFRIATVDARFGAPIARTLGNCLSMSNIARIMSAFGVPRSKRMLMLAELLDAHEALACGYLLEAIEPDELECVVERISKQLLANAPLTMQASKESMRRVVGNVLPDDEDMIKLCYGSNDFKAGVQAFLAKAAAVWTGT